MSINPLAELTPAECLVLLDLTSANAHEAIKLTLMDLWAKQSIRFDMRRERTRFLRREVTRIYVGRGLGEHVFQAKLHERVLSANVPETAEVRFDRYTRDTAAAIRSVRHFKHEFLLKPMADANLLERQKKAMVFTTYALTEAGSGLREELKAMLDQSEASLRAWLASDLIRAKQLLAQLGTKILLLPGLLPDIRDARERLAISPLPDILAALDSQPWRQTSSREGRMVIELEIVFDLLDVSEELFSAASDAIDSASFDSGDGDGNGD